MAGDRYRVVRAVTMSIGGTILLLELGARTVTGSLGSWAPPLDVGGHWIVDRDVGYRLRDDIAVHVREGYDVRTRAHGIRSNGDQHPSRDRPITLVVGDSFAFGDEVLDSESWPAALERAIDAPVLNAAVAGFGLDQAVLRAERLAPIVHPDRIIVSFVPHDVRRCAMSIWSHHAKPWFDVYSGRLRAHAIPRRAVWRATIAPALAHSVLIDSLFHDALRSDGPDTFEHHSGEEVACLLLDRLLALGRECRAAVVLVAQPQTPSPGEARYAMDPEDPRPDAKLASIVIACAHERGLAVVDAISALAAVPVARRDVLFRGNGHNSPQGNQLIADLVRDELERGR